MVLTTRLSSMYIQGLLLQGNLKFSKPILLPLINIFPFRFTAPTPEVLPPYSKTFPSVEKRRTPYGSVKISLKTW